MCSVVLEGGSGHARGLGSGSGMEEGRVLCEERGLGSTGPRLLFP